MSYSTVDETKQSFKKISYTVLFPKILQAFKNSISVLAIFCYSLGISINQRHEFNSNSSEKEGFIMVWNRVNSNLFVTVNLTIF